jgi:hypothetical protein
MNPLVAKVREVEEATGVKVYGFLADRIGKLDTALEDKTRLLLERSAASEEFRVAKNGVDYQRAAYEAYLDKLDAGEPFTADDLPPDPAPAAEAKWKAAQAAHLAVESAVKILDREIASEILDSDEFDRWLAKCFDKLMAPSKAKFTLQEAEAFQIVRERSVQKIQALALDRARHLHANAAEIGELVEAFAEVVEAGEGSMPTIQKISDAARQRAAAKAKEAEAVEQAKKDRQTKDAQELARIRLGKSLDEGADVATTGA